MSDALYNELQKNDQLVFKCWNCKNKRISNGNDNNMLFLETAFTKQSESIAEMAAAITKLTITQDKMLIATQEAETARRQKEERAERERQNEEQRRFEEEERDRRKNNVIFAGTELATLGSTAEDRVKEVIKLLDVDIDATDIQPSEIRPLNDRSILVKLNEDMKRKIVRNRKNLQGRQLFIDDDKTRSQRTHEYELRQKVKDLKEQHGNRIFFVRDGNIMTKDRPDSAAYNFRYLERAQGWQQRNQ